jgi:hypothetical protein
MRVPLRQVKYEGMTLTAGAFEVAASGRFVVTLSIARDLSGTVPRDAQLFEPPSHDGMFDDVDEALEWAIAFGRAIVDGDIPGASIEDL